MVTKTTIAVTSQLRKTIKKLAALLDVTQGEVVEKAILAFEKTIISSSRDNLPTREDSKAEVQQILDDATIKVWKDDPERKRVQLALMKGPETIDDYIIRNWKTGLKEIDQGD